MTQTGTWNWAAARDSAGLAARICERVEAGSLDEREAKEGLLRLFTGAAALSGADLRPLVPFIRALMGL